MGKFQDELARRETGQASPGETFTRQASGQFLENVASLPNFVMSAVKAGNPLRLPIAFAQEALQQRMGGQGFDLGGFYQAERASSAQALDPVFNTPKAEDFQAMGQLAGEGAAGLANMDFSQMTPFGEAVQQQQMTNELQAEQNPMADLIGRGTGTAATMVTGKAPIASVKAAERLAGTGVKPGLRSFANELFKKFNPKIRHTKAEEVLPLSATQKISRGAARAGEAGLEGAIVGILENQDPLEIAGLSAGSQLAGSLALNLIPSTGKGVLGLAAMAGGLTYLARQAQDFGPGENDIFEAVDFAFDKIALGLTAGTLAGLVGMGRIREGVLADTLPVIAESITQIPRSAVQQFISDVRKEKAESGDSETQRVMEKITKNPDYFGPEVKRRIERAIKNGNSIPGAIEALKSNKQFRDKLLELE